MINPPEGETSRYYVIVYRSGGLGGQSRPTVIGVDKFNHVVDSSGRVIAYQGVDDADEVQVEFPAGTQYLFIKGTLVKSMTPLEAAKLQKEEDEEFERVLGKDVTDGPPMLSSGPGGYL
jgi:hypothetical protein